MAEAIERRNVIAARLVVEAGFCSQPAVEEAIKHPVQSKLGGAKLGLLQSLLKYKRLTPAQYRMLNIVVNYELRREQELSMARLLVKGKRIPADKMDEVIAMQEPYYREGKEFPKLMGLLQKKGLLTPQQASQAMAKPAEPAAPPPPEAPADAMVMDHCRVAAKRHPIKGIGGAERQVLVLTVTGKLDGATAGDFDAFLQTHIKSGTQDVVVDLTAVQEISSAGMGVLAAAVRNARKRGGDVRLGGASSRVRAALAQTALDSLVKIYGTPTDGVDSYRPG